MLEERGYGGGRVGGAMGVVGGGVCEAGLSGGGEGVYHNEVLLQLQYGVRGWKVVTIGPVFGRS